MRKGEGRKWQNGRNANRRAVQSCRVGGAAAVAEGGVGQKLRVDFTDLIVWQLPKGRAKERGRYSEREAYREEERKI